jgi:hypothetical protein
MTNAAPNAPYVDFGKANATKPMSEATKTLVDDGWNLKQRIDVLAAELKEINGKLVKKHPGVSLVVPGQCRCPIARSSSVKLKGDSAIVQLKEFFGRKFSTYVKRAVSHSPTADLKTIAQDEDHEFFEEVSECVDVSYGAYPPWQDSCRV